MSDKGSKGERKDESGPAMKEGLTAAGFDVVEELILPDEKALLKKELIRLCDQRQVSLILTSGGTGFSERDTTPGGDNGGHDAQRTRDCGGDPGRIHEIYKKGHALPVEHRSYGGQTLIVNLPGSPKAVRESMEIILESVQHGLGILRGSESECAR